MKILSMNLNGEDINFSCPHCCASFDLESKDDFYINKWIFKPINRFGVCDYNIQIPEYNIKCPVCGYETYIGLDPRDCGEDFNKALLQGIYAEIIFNRKDWEERYKTKVKIKSRKRVSSRRSSNQ